MDSSTRSFTTPGLTTIQYEYFQKQLKQIRDYIDFGTLENFDLLITDDDFHFDSEVDEQVDQQVSGRYGFLLSV